MPLGIDQGYAPSGRYAHESGIGLLDELPAASRIPLLAIVAEALRKHSVRTPRLTAIIEATLAAVLETIRYGLTADWGHHPGFERKDGLSGGPGSLSRSLAAARRPSKGDSPPNSE